MSKRVASGLPPGTLVYAAYNPRRLGIVRAELPVQVLIAGFAGAVRGWEVEWDDGSIEQVPGWGLRDFDELLGETERKLQGHQKRRQAAEARFGLGPRP